MADNIPVMVNATISEYDIIRGDTCSTSYNDFITRVNIYIKNGYQPYGKLNIVSYNNGSYCKYLDQVVVKYNKSANVN